MHIFVIGAFDKDMPLFSKISDLADAHYPGVVEGRALRMEVGYPALCLKGFDKVSGTVLEVKDSSIALNLFDAFFGYSLQAPDKSLHLRSETKCALEDGQSLNVICYTLNLNKAPKRLQEIPLGDWRGDYRSHPPIPEVLDEKEREYICKLANAKGRDIVRIDLNVYRKLMGGGIVVDKGRRVALSKLGKEVYKYLQ